MKNISLRGSLKVYATVIILSALLFITSCGPSNEEIMAMERAQAQERIAAEAEHARAVEEVRKQKQMEEARLAKILAMEKAGDEAARQGELEKALDNYLEVLKNVQRYGEQDQRIRQSVIKVVRAMHAPPAIPESVMRSMVRGETRLRTGGTGSYEDAATEMEQAVLYAPWLADAYFNLGTVQEKAGKFNEAIQNFKLYLLAAPRVQNATAIQAKIYELEILKEDQEKMKAMEGEWIVNNGGGKVILKIEGPNVHMSGWLSAELQKKGRELNGFITSRGWTDEVGPEGVPCTIPGQTNPISGIISADGRTIEFKFMSDDYKMNYDINHGEGSYYDYLHKKCIGVVVVSRTEGKITITRNQ